MIVTIKNACSITAMQELLEDPQWGPKEYCRMVHQDGGLLGEKTVLLEQYAPVKVWFDSELSGDDNTAEIYNDSGRQALSSDEKIIIGYVTGERAAHLECIYVKDVAQYADKDIRCIVTRQQNQCSTRGKTS